MNFKSWLICFLVTLLGLSAEWAAEGRAEVAQASPTILLVLSLILLRSPSLHHQALLASCPLPQLTPCVVGGFWEGQPAALSSKTGLCSLTGVLGSQL